MTHESHPASRTDERSQWVRMRARANTSMRGATWTPGSSWQRDGYGGRTEDGCYRSRGGGDDARGSFQRLQAPLPGSPRCDSIPYRHAACRCCALRACGHLYISFLSWRGGKPRTDNNIEYGEDGTMRKMPGSMPLMDRWRMSIRFPHPSAHEHDALALRSKQSGPSRHRILAVQPYTKGVWDSCG